MLGDSSSGLGVYFTKESDVVLFIPYSFCIAVCELSMCCFVEVRT